ncbi:MAG: restriction endonuclease subunit S [Cetobacterium somerae]|uniref:restriction endonuclease subunit S n=1 Tax=Cetobacterium somerae TaxID=188913 RepID=UPI003F35E137
MEELKEGWRRVKLGNLCSVKGGKRLPKGENLQTIPNKHPYIRIKDLVETKNLKLTSNFEFVPEKIQEKIGRYIVSENDIIISIVGTIGLINKIDKTLHNGNLTENCVKLINLLNISPDFLYYYLKSEYGQFEIKKGIVGAVQQKLPIKNIQNIEINLPSLETQEKIASILSALDDKIEINNEMNKTLEEMAQTLFKRWFIDFDFPNENGEPYRSSGGKMVDSELGEIPEGWEVSNLGDLFKFVKGKKPKIVSENFSEETPLKYLTIKGFNGDENLYASEDKTILINKKDIVMVMDGASSGDVYIGKSGVLGSTFSKIEKIKEIDWSYIYLILKYYESDIKSHTTGSAIPHTDKGYVEKIRVPLPNLELLNILSKKISEIIKIKLNNQEEIQSLTEIRDTLLPKLMGRC